MRRLEILWQHPLGREGLFSGTGLEICNGRVLFQFTDKGASRIRCLDRHGAMLWDHSWADLGVFTEFTADSVYAGGEAVRRLSVLTGAVLAERPTDETLDPVTMFASGPVYRTNDRFEGLDENTLDLLWKAPDPEGRVFAHEDRLCRIAGNELIVITPPALTETRVTLERPIEISEMHTHIGDLWCQFALTAGGRSAVDVKSGKIVWSFSEPGGYGLTVYDGTCAYSTFGPTAAYDLRTGIEHWTSTVSLTTSPYVEDGKFYGAGFEGQKPAVFVLDAADGRVELAATFDFPLSGWGFEPSPVRPLGRDQLIVGMRTAIVCLSMK